VVSFRFAGVLGTATGSGYRGCVRAVLGLSWA
jgi:hypothetical protein